MPYQYNFLDEIIVDSFAGGGGASTGIEWALGRIVDIAINHDLAAVRMHLANHPYTQHYCESIFNVDPKKAVRGRKVALLWGSPDCTDFSRAKGGTPVRKEIRGLAWVLVKWAAEVKPRVIMMENVPEFEKWGPLRAIRDKITGRIKKANGEIAAKGESVPFKKQLFEADPNKRGTIFVKFIAALCALGYHVEWLKLKGCDYGAPTTRKRFFLIARRDGQSIIWPKPTHGDPKSEAVKNGALLPWRTAAECIDFSKPTPSIFERKKPLAENTIKRIMRGINKFVIKSEKPFIIPTGISGVVDAQFKGNGHDYRDPMPTVMSGNTLYKIDVKLVPLLTHYHAATSEKEARGTSLDSPVPVIDTSNRHALTVGLLSKAYGGNYKGAGSELSEPIHTITAQDHNTLVSAFVQKYYGSGDNTVGIENPAPTVTARDRMGIVTSHLTVLRNHMDGKPLNEPIPAITAGGGHIGEVRTYLAKYSGAEENFGHWAKIRALLNKYGGYNLADDEIILFEIDGALWFMSDIGMRMLEPRELFAAQGFPPDYIIEWDCDGNPITKTEQVAKCGNSVCPQVPKALVRANLPELAAKRDISTMAQVRATVAV